jgi:hypothetical protein
MTTNCIPAETGNFVDPDDATAQVKCAAGTYQSRRGQTGCTAAPAGSFVDASGATNATKCSAGTYQPLTGATSCIRASANFYVPTSGQTRQTPCPVGSTQPLEGSDRCILAKETNDQTEVDTDSVVTPSTPTTLARPSVVTTTTTASRPGASGSPATSAPVATTTPLEKPTLPVVAKSVKVGKAVTIAAPGGKTSQGLVAVATTSTTTCTVRETAAGFSVTGVKVGSCRVKVTAIGDSRYLTLTTEFRVNVVK